MWVRSLGQEYPLEEGMATHSSVLAWRIPWTEEPGGLQKESDMTKATEYAQKDIQKMYFLPKLLCIICSYFEKKCSQGLF